jgi:lipoprotein NlpD
MRIPETFCHLGAVTLLAFGLGACAPTSFSPVTEQGASQRQTDAPLREVVAGDTLYSIAWETGHDYREVATWNSIPPPYLIKPGQKLRLAPAEPDGTMEPPAAPATPQTHAVRRGETLYRVALNYDVEAKDLAEWNHIAPPYRIKPGQTLRLTAPAPTTIAPPEKKTKPEKAKTATKKLKPATATGPKRPATTQTVLVGDKHPAPPQIGHWIWPTDGTVIERFNNAGTRGIDVSGRKGQAINAAAEGQVVYQGGGLRGYGQLIILKHSAEFLSAYAHCDRIHVKEGDVIKRGQKIADMGNSGTDRTKLHFEIRYRGTPVDALRYLPKK